MSKRIIRSKSDKETQELAKKLGREQAQAKSLICLYGDLGTGKTTFVRGLATGLGILSRITSPTFTYQRIHKMPRKMQRAKNKFLSRNKLYHFDCYRFKTANSKNIFLVNNIMEALEKNDGIVVIEWAEYVEKFLPAERIDVRLEYAGENERKISIENF